MAIVNRRKRILKTGCILKLKPIHVSTYDKSLRGRNLCKGFTVGIKGVIKRRKYLSGTVSSSSNARH